MEEVNHEDHVEPPAAQVDHLEQPEEIDPAAAEVEVPADPAALLDSDDPAQDNAAAAVVEVL